VKVKDAVGVTSVVNNL